MSWWRLDDKMAFHSKMLVAGNEAVGAWARAGAWSAGELQDGFVPDHVVDLIAPKRVWAKLVSARLVEREDGGYRLHDFLVYNPSREDVLAQREKERAKKAEQRAKAPHGGDGRFADSKGVPGPVPEGQPKGLPDDVPGGVHPYPSRPVPSRPQEQDPPLAPPPGGKAKRKARIPETWEPDAKTVEKFQADGLDVRGNIAEFRDYWLGRGDPRADWDAAFRGWIRRLSADGKVPRYVAPKAKTPPAEPFAPPPEGFAEALAALKNPNEKLIADVLGTPETAA